MHVTTAMNQSAVVAKNFAPASDTSCVVTQRTMIVFSVLFDVSGPCAVVKARFFSNKHRASFAVLAEESYVLCTSSVHEKNRGCNDVDVQMNLTVD